MTVTAIPVNGAKPIMNGRPSRVDGLLSAIPGQSADALQDWALQQAPLLAALTTGELERFNLALIRSGLTKSFVEKSLARVIRESGDGGDGSDGSETGGKSKQADKLLELIREKARFFTGNDGDLYASVKMNGHTECYRLNSTSFNNYLSNLFYSEHNTVIGAQARADAKAVMGFWCAERIEPVYVRVAGHEGKIYLDRGAPDWSAIEVDANGWRIVANPPVNFRRTSAMGELPTPVASDDVTQLALFANVDEDHWPLLVAFIVGCMYPQGPYPLLILTGEQGSAKSTTLRVIKRLVDPSAAELRRQPEDIRDLMIAASNTWLITYDNVSYLRDEVADTMCVIATGGGFSRKANYTDGDEFIINVMRPQAINGIGDFATRGDLLDRAIIIATPVILEHRREDEKSFWGRFDQVKGELLGALLHCVSMGLRNLDATQLTAKPRMADFARFAVAAEPGYNADGETPFIDLYMENREQNTASILETSPLARVIWELVRQDGRWVGSSRLLFSDITERAKDTDRRSPGWPGAENKLKSPLMRVAPALRKAGIDVQYRRSKTGGQWEIAYTKPNKSDTSLLPFLEEK
jgi:hypothetical protein